VAPIGASGASHGRVRGREITGCSRQQAVEVIGPHFDWLVAAKAECFAAQLADHWADFYS